jgi:hypothetical protein
MSDLYRLAYFSSAQEYFSKPQLLTLLNKAREKNASLGITGMLLFKEGNFMQLIEGEKVALHSLFQTISDDPRHHHLLVIFNEAAQERLFADWTMGFYDLADPDLQTLPGFSPYMNHPLDGAVCQNDPSGCLALFKLFRGYR